MTDETWSKRELPLLRIALREVDKGGSPSFEQLAEETGVELGQVWLAMRALQDAGYVKAYFAAAESGMVTAVNERARRELGSWPQPLSLSFTEFVDFLLVRLYDLDRDEGGQFQDVDALAAELRADVPDRWPYQAIESLKRRGWVDASMSTDQGTYASITGDGRLYVEGRQHETEVIERYRQQPANYVYVEGNVGNLAVGTAGDVSQISLSGDVQAQALGIVAEMRDALNGDDSLDEETREEALGDVSALEGQIKRRKLNKNVVVGLIGSLSGIASVAQLGIKLGELLT